jgi:SET domain-containing protein
VKIDMRIYRNKEDILKFFRDQNVKYLERTRIGWVPLLEMNLDNSPYYLENIELFQGLFHRYQEDIEQCKMAPIYIKQIDEKLGFGVFAADEISKDAFIGEYAGIVQIPASNAGREMRQGGYESDFSWYYLDQVEGAPELEINGRLEGNEMRFVNHSDKFNMDVEHTLFQGHWIIFFKAAKTIQKHEQLLISYGDQYWGEDIRDILDI